MKWDLFLSHASEDKDFVGALAAELQYRGLKIWYSNFILRMGQSLRRSIDEGLRESRFGVVVISPSFLAKEWPQRELDGLVAREINGTPVILPIWHKVDFETVSRYSPMLADRVAVVSSLGVGRVADTIVEAFTGTAQETAVGARSSQEIIAHLTLDDSRVLRLVCEGLLESGGSFLTPDEIQQQAPEFGLSTEQLIDSLEILDSEGLVRNKGAFGKRVTRVRLTVLGFSLYARHFIPDYELLRKRAAQAIVQKDLLISYDLAEALGRNENVIKCLLREFEAEGSLTLSRSISPYERIATINPRLRRFARE
ncbi:MAG TPA: toll/interleukin-1 receptor domain-containing protein [Thermoanaerobaculia bacterium]